jgi:C4-dicarboxylate-specific signal transduction histidine kinase
MQPKVEVARRTAEVAVRILDGEKAGDIKTPPLPLAPPKYDWRLMQRWGIKERDLPPGSAVYFTRPALWETYRWEITTVTIALLLQGAMIILLVLERHRRQFAEVNARQRLVELAHVNRFSTAGEVAASIAHEISQPLGATLNNVETAKIMLDAPALDRTEMRAIVDDIGRDNRRATDIIKHLRGYVKKAPLEQRNVDLNDEVSEALNFLSAEAKCRNVSLRSKLAAAPLRVNGDPIQLEQVLSNLILNAFDAVADDGQARKVVKVKTARVGNFAEVSIADSGPGVPPDAMKKIFEPFYSTKEYGMGMGLSIVRTIVEAHNGTISVENGSGAVFRVRLPLA